MIIASFPKGSFPDNSWPVGTWPAAFVDTTDIQYTEVMEFAVCIAASADFDVVLPNDDVVVISYPDIIVSGACAPVEYVNGVYAFQYMQDGKPLYTAPLSGGTQIGTVFWIADPGGWYMITDGDGAVFESTDNVATPDLVTTWVGIAYPEATPPTVTSKPDSILTEIVNFTVEMPMVIEIETYEELSK